MFWQLSQEEKPEHYAEQVVMLLSSRPGQARYVAMLAFAGMLERDAEKFWQGDL